MPLGVDIKTFVVFFDEANYPCPFAFAVEPGGFGEVM